jgi:hypothetical protein
LYEISRGFVILDKVKLKIAERTRSRKNRRLRGRRLTYLKRMDNELPEFSLYCNSKRYRECNIITASDIKSEKP